MSEPPRHETVRPAAAPEPREAVFHVAPEAELLYSLGADGKRKFIRPVVKRGHYWTIRRRFAYALIALFFALPLLPIGGYPAVQFDLLDRHFHFFGATFFATDSLLLLAFGAGVILTVFFVGSTFGRMWCGYTCPQTVYLEFLFRPIESLLEGTPLKQKKLNAAPWTPAKVLRKATKWGLWALVALAMASTFVAYFVGWKLLVLGALTAPEHMTGALGTIAALTGLILFDFGWFRDQMCTVACPYGRLQNVLSDADTILVAYDEQRGEPRARVIDRLKERIYGDCIDCRSCVNACPTGTDIRRGLQLECIGSAQCVDACNGVMTGMGKPPGLIGYTSAAEQQGRSRRLWRPRTVIYLALLTVAWAALVVMVATRGAAQVELVRGGREAYRMLPGGQVANQQRLRVTNHLADEQQFTVEVTGPRGARLVLSESPIVVAGSQVVTVNAVTTVAPELFVDGQVQATYAIRSDRGFDQQVQFLLLGPYR